MVSNQLRANTERRLNKLSSIFFLLCTISWAHSAEEVAPESLLIKAENGDAVAQFELGMALDDGELFGPKVRESFSWIRQAADQGLADAEYQVGVMYLQGRGTPQNTSLAQDFVERAALSGISGAQLQMGEFRLAEEEYELAYIWFALGAAGADYEERFNLAIELRDIAAIDIPLTRMPTLQSFVTLCFDSGIANCNPENDFDEITEINSNATAPENLDQTSASDLLAVLQAQNSASDEELAANPVNARTSNVETRQNDNKQLELRERESSTEGSRTPNNCLAIDTEDGSLSAAISIAGASYPLILTMSNIPAAISLGLVSDLGLRIRRNPNLRVLSDTGKDREMEYIADLEVELFGASVNMDEVVVIDPDSKFITMSLRLFEDYLLQLDFPNSRLCLFDEDSFDLATLQNITIDSSAITGDPVILVEFPDQIEAWLTLSPSYSGAIRVDETLTRFLRLANKDSLNPPQSEFSSTTIDYLTLGPYELGGIIVEYPQQGTRTNLTRNQQTLTMTNIAKDRASKGRIGIEILKHFVITLDMKSERGHIYTP